MSYKDKTSQSVYVKEEYIKMGLMGDVEEDVWTFKDSDDWFNPNISPMMALNFCSQCHNDYKEFKALMSTWNGMEVVLSHPLLVFGIIIL